TGAGGRPSDRGRMLAQLEGRRALAPRPLGRMLHLDDHLALAQLRVVVGLCEVVDWPHARLETGEGLEPLAPRPGQEELPPGGQRLRVEGRRREVRTAHDLTHDRTE